VDYEPTAEVEIDEIAESLQREAERIQTYLAEQRIVANVDGPDEEQCYSVTLAHPARRNLSLPDDALLRVWLITQPANHARPVQTVSSGELARLDGLELAQLTTFVAFELELRSEGRKHVTRFVLNVPLRGAPRGRHEAVLRALLHDKDRLLRYLLFVLAEAQGVQTLSSADLVAIIGTGDSDGSGRAQFQFPLFEALLRTLARDPHKLSEIASLLDDLGDDGNLDELLPDGFRRVWEPIWAARGER
jgi:hypothetical protein